MEEKLEFHILHLHPNSWRQLLFLVGRGQKSIDLIPAHNILCKCIFIKFFILATLDMGTISVRSGYGYHHTDLNFNELGYRVILP